MLLGTQALNAEGHLEIGGCDAVDLAKEFGTPLYVIDEAAVRANCREYKAAFDAAYPDHKIYYASKAFLTQAMARIIFQEGLNIDVASLGELYVALSAGFPAERIALHGNNKSAQELEYAVEQKIGHVVLDNEREIEMLAEIASRHDTLIDVLVRAAPGVDPHTHRRIRTGQADTKFGFNITNGAALNAVKKVLDASHLRFKGIHCHVGSQLLDTDTHHDAAEIMAQLLGDIQRETGAKVAILNIGGGLGVRYRTEQHPPSYAELAARISDALKQELDRLDLPYPQLQQEPGRSLVGEAGVTLYTIGAMKTVPITEEPGQRTYVSIDGGMSDNPRPQLYDAVYECLIAERAGEPANDIVTIAGKHCETDILIWNATLNAPQTGDTLAVQTTGAYNHAMASNYNRFLRPAVVLVNEGHADLIVKRDSLEQLVQNELIPDRLRA